MIDSKKSKQATEFIVCPECRSTGRAEHGLSCSNCSGLGQGAFVMGRFFYWGRRLTRAIIELDNVRIRIHQIVNFIAFGFGILGIISLAAWIFLVSKFFSSTSELMIWREQHFFILLFWLSVIADMFVLYRISEEERNKHNIRAVKYEAKDRQIKLPNNWEELKDFPRKNKIDVSHGYAKEAIETVEKAYLLAHKFSHAEVSPYHLFFSCLPETQVAAIFSRLNVNAETLTNKVKEQIEKIPRGGEKTVLSHKLKEILVESYLFAYNFGQKKVTPKNFIIPILKKEENLRELLFDLEVDEDKIFNVILWFIINEKQVENYRDYKKLARFKPGTNMDRAYTAVATQVLNQISYDLTLAAKWGKLDFCVSRDEEISSIWQHFASGKNGILLVGPKGVGKNTVIDGIAQLMVKEEVPKYFQDKRLVEIDAARLISGASPAQAQGRMQAVINEVVRAGNIILYINNIENIIGITSGEAESLDLSEVLASAVDRHEIYCLASATQENYTKYIEGKSLDTIMAKIQIGEPQGNQAIQIIESKIAYFEGKYKVYFSYNAIEEVIKLSSRYIHDKYLPEKAIGVLELVAVRVAKEKGEHALVTKEDIAGVVSEETGIPLTKIGESEREQLINLEDKIHERMINQEEAVEMVSSSLRRARTELREGKRPIANFLFLGPTGVGKTELAKTVTEVYFGREEYMIRIDMSEYQHPDSVKKMIGDSSGAKGYLTEAVRRSPFSLILLDEVEKAHGDILNLFLQVMDDGRLTDGQGRTIDFTSSILIATSNAGALYIQEQIYKGTPTDDIRQVLINEYLNKVMRPELINRFDGVVVFEPLSMEHVVEIARIMIGGIGRMLEAKGIGLEALEEGVRVLAKLGFDPKFGARPLRRLLQERIENQIANKILAGELVRRDTVIIDEMGNVEVRKGKLI